jgi:hypothetical protein
MSTKVYDTKHIELIDGTILLIGPLKIFYLRQFMDRFDQLEKGNAENTLDALIDCSMIAMQQYYPPIKNREQLEDSIDIANMYKLIEYCSGIKIGGKEPEDNKNNIDNDSKSKNSWESLDLAKLESEIFLIGIWKDYEDLEKSLSLPELFATLEAKRESDYQDKKFTASLKGIDLDEANGKKEEDPWEAMKARVASKLSGVGDGNPNDVTALQGVRAQQMGFGIGMGLDYEVMTE